MGPNGKRSKGSAFKIEYWEPSAVIEVSCRSSYSMLKPGLSGRGATEIQSCQGFNQPGNMRWFFEARVWAIDGKDGGLRHQSQMGAVNGQRAAQCSEYSDPPGDTTKNNISGYGRKKWDSFTRGSASGPAGSWEAYISDKDQTWATDEGGASSVPTQAACSPGGNDLANCWGPMNETGWVIHSNPRVAAALVAWRAHQKALKAGKVSKDLGKGYQMMMDYPFQKYAGAFGESMGAPSGGKTGSQCFKPGDAGPEWYGGMKPEDIPAAIKAMKPGDTKVTTEMNSGIYIFTIWVKTSCIRWQVSPKGPGGLPDFINGGTLCTYQDKS